MSEKFTVARIKKFGKNFEISIDPDKAVQFKQGGIDYVGDVLLADNIFSDVKKGLVSSQEDLQQAFQTTDVNEIAKIILQQGEVQLTAEHRSQERDQKRKKLINLISQQAVDPTTNLPHPATRIEAALEEGKVSIDYNKSIEEQFEEIVRQLQPILPIKIEQKQMTVIIPAQFSGKMYNLVHRHKVLKENWLNNGDWKVVLEVPAGLAQEFIDKLNSFTSGQVVVEIE